jgi:hypothetical protein
MRSRVIRDPEPTAQMTLQFDPGLTERFGSLRECLAQGVYQRGLGRIAIDLNKAPGNLSVELSDDPARNFSVDSLETYLAKTGDKLPIYYLVGKYLAEEKADPQAEAMAEFMPLLSKMLPLMKKAGLV